jgi:hypothetical protein
MDLLKQVAEDDVESFKIFTRSPNLSVNLTGQVILQRSLIARFPVTKNVFDKGDQAAVAFNVRLLPQKIDEPVVSGGEAASAGYTRAGYRHSGAGRYPSGEDPYPERKPPLISD